MPDTSISDDNRPAQAPYTRYPTTSITLDKAIERKTLSLYLHELTTLSLSTCLSSLLLSFADILTGNLLARIFHLSFPRYSLFILAFWWATYFPSILLWSFFVFWRRIPFNKRLLPVFSAPRSNAGFIAYAVLARWSQVSWLAVAVLRYSDVAAAAGQGYVFEWRVRVWEQVAMKAGCAAWALAVQGVLTGVVALVAEKVRRMQLHWSVGLVGTVVYCASVVRWSLGVGQESTILPPRPPLPKKPGQGQTPNENIRAALDSNMVLAPTLFRFIFAYSLFILGEATDTTSPFSVPRTLTMSIASLLPDQVLIPMSTCVSMFNALLLQNRPNREYRVHWICRCGHESYDDLYNVPQVGRLPEVLVSLQGGGGGGGGGGMVESARMGVEGALFSRVRFEMGMWRLLGRDVKRLVGFPFYGAWIHPRVGVDGMVRGCPLVPADAETREGEKRVVHFVVSRG